MIVAEHLSKRFGKLVAVDSINFRIAPGRVVGFLGPNGAGKTTTIRMIAGFLSPTGGSIEVDGIDVQRQPLAVRRRIGYLPESTPLYTEMRVDEYLRFRARLFGLPRARHRTAVEQAVRRCWLEPVRRRPIGQLSKGFRQRVGLAAALLHEPPLLILDEPTVGLDPSQIREVRGLIRELAGRHTILLSTHILAEVDLACDDIIVIAGGRVQAQGPLEQIRTGAARHCRYVVETDHGEAPAVLRALEDVADVETRPLDDEWHRIVVTPRRGAGDLRAVIGATLARRGAMVRELRRETTTLEQLFLELITGAQPSAPEAAPA